MGKEKLTKCGCDDCERKAEKLITWVNEVTNRHLCKKEICLKSKMITEVYNDSQKNMD